MSNVINEGNYLRDVLRWEFDEGGRLSRKQVTVISGQKVSMGSVLGKVLYAVSATGVADGGNTGAGTVTAVTGKGKQKIGTYTLECTAYVASPLAGTFMVFDPDGNRLPDANIGVNANEQIGFTLADGSPAITVGDTWTITVAHGSGQVRAINFDAVDGTQKAYGISIADYDATDAAVEGVAIERDAVIVAANLVWPVTSPAVSSDQKAQALRELALVGIVARPEA